MSEAPILSLLPEKMAELLRAVGCRVEEVQDQNGAPHLRSATSGLGFNVRFGNRAAAPAEGYLDFTFVALLKLEGDFPAAALNNWNAQKRFARLYRSQDFLILEMDSIVAGGVQPDLLRSTIEIWDRLVQELILFLRNAAGTPANAA